MENNNPELAELPREQPEAASNIEASVLNSNDTFSVAKDDKGSDSDTNSEELNCNEERNNLNNGNSQFYESSDSKIDYAVKIDDNDTLSDIEDIKTDSASADSEDSALGSLPPDGALTDREEEAPDRSDGSDSGLGSETNEDAKLPDCSLNAPCTSDINHLETCKVAASFEHAEEIDEKEVSDNPPVIPVEKKALKSNLKRKCEEETVEEPIAKKKKESIRFDNVTVYYFPRVQGFTCVPSQGGSTLGMEWEHSHIQHFTLAEHALEQRRLHRQILQQLKSDRHSLQGAVLSSSEDSDTEEETSDISESELDLDSYFFLQPVPTRQRRALLRAAGLRKIEGYEKDECRDIRTSRELCGCACKGVCNPESCSCSASGIKCQVDRLNFPCGCSRDGCGNTTGRIEFNPIRVRTHFIHTLMRLGLQKKNEEHPDVVKRQWAEAHHTNPSPCMANTLYEREQHHVQDDGLLRDVNLTPRVEVESCVNAGSFNNVHCDLNTPAIQGNVQKDIPYGYRNDTVVTPNHMNINENNIHFENTNNHHVSPYTSNILQGKGPPYPVGNTMGFNTMTTDMQRFPCDLNYTYEHHTDNHHFKGLQSFSATRFEEFAHNSQMSMFSNYGHVYVPDYMHKPSTTMHDHNALQYHAMPQNHYAMYKNNAECASVDANKQTNDSHYTTLMTMPYQNSNKPQTVENDENWFSHSTLMNVDHYDHSTQDAPEAPPAPAQPPPAPDSEEAASSEPTENFGELIKKTMVESVTV